MISSLKSEGQNTRAAGIQLVFGSDVQWLSDKAFGDYVQSLQRLFILMEQEGYE